TGKEVFGKNPIYSAINRPHQAVHDSVKSIPSYVQEGSLENAEKIIEAFATAESNSTELFSVLNKL
ncbi:MAG: hypothetical protein U9O86_09765, partial [Campylobacterota bacterium]|nr:hypothetical protein [Campylobacterota bacterium]